MKSHLKRLLPALTIKSFVIAAAAALLALQGCKPGSVDRALELTAAEMNKRAPMMVDPQTRLDKTSTAPNKTLVYHYTLVSLRKADLKQDDLVSKLRPGIIANYKTNAQMKTLRDNNVTLEYQYSDKEGVEVAKFAVNPKDF